MRAIGPEEVGATTQPAHPVNEVGLRLGLQLGYHSVESVQLGHPCVQQDAEAHLGRAIVCLGCRIHHFLRATLQQQERLGRRHVTA
jgi:hypothetical protein